MELAQFWLSAAFESASMEFKQKHFCNILTRLVSFLQTDTDPFVSRFHADGFVMCPSIISSKAVAGFVQQIREELEDSPSAKNSQSGTDKNGHARHVERERCVGSLILDDPKTWPQKGSRRVVECAPAGVGEHWHALHRGLTPFLNQLMGEHCWQLPFNTGKACQIRHVYCPITFPEHTYSCSAATKTSSTVPKCVDGCNCVTSRPVRFESWKDEVRRTPFTSEALDAPLRWQPVSRRRFRGKGWHIDIGPGFSTDAKRRFKGVCVCVCVCVAICERSESSFFF